MTGNRATILRGLEAVWATQGREFVTFEPSEDSGPQADLWIQFLDGEVNVRWTSGEDPSTELTRRSVRLPRGAAMRSFVPGSNVVIDVGDAPIGEVADLIDALFTRIVARAPRRRVVARVDRHG